MDSLAAAACQAEADVVAAAFGAVPTSIHDRTPGWTTAPATAVADSSRRLAPKRVPAHLKDVAGQVIKAKFVGTFLPDFMCLVVGVASGPCDLIDAT